MGAMISIDRVDLSKDLQVKVVAMAHISGSKKSHCYFELHVISLRFLSCPFSSFSPLFISFTPF